MSILSWGEFRPDVSDYQGQITHKAQNVFPRGDGYGPVKSLVALTAALPAACRGYFVALATDGTISIFAGTATKLYQLSNTDYTWTDVSKGAGSYTTLAAGDQWQFAQFNTRVMAVTSTTVPQSFVLGVSSAFADLAGSPPTAKYITVVNQFTVLSGIASPNSYRVQWSARSDPTGWTAGTNESDLQDFGDGGLVRGVAGGEFGLIFQDTTIRRMTYAPGTNIVFQIDRISEDMGLLAPFSIIRSREKVFFLSNAGFQMWMPGAPVTPIGKEHFDRTFSADWDSSSAQLMLGANDPTSSRVMWAYKSLSGSSGLFDKILIYDQTLNRAALITGISGEYIASLAKPGVTLEGLDSVNASIDALTISLDDYPAAFGKQLSIANSTHKIGFLSGSNLEATLESAEVTNGAQRSFIRGQRPITDAATVYGAINTKDKESDADEWEAEVVMDSRGLVPHRQECRLFRFRNRIPSGTTWSYHVGIDPDVITTGQR